LVFTSNISGSGYAYGVVLGSGTTSSSFFMTLTSCEVSNITSSSVYGGAFCIISGKDSVHNITKCTFSSLTNVNCSGAFICFYGGPKSAEVSFFLSFFFILILFVCGVMSGGMFRISNLHFFLFFSFLLFFFFLFLSFFCFYTCID
jgi:hypothetical protein